jgi:glycosyltransferase involved in cell wall biosynthesis
MRLRVAYVCADPGVPVFGRKGCTVHVQEVLRAFLRAGAEVDVFATRFDGAAPADLAGVRVHALPPAPKGDVAERERRSLAANEDLRVLLESHGPFDLVYERYSLWSYAGMEFARDAGCAGVLEVNAPLIQEQGAHRALVHCGEAVQVAERAFAAAGVLAPVSGGVAEHVRGFLDTAGKVHVVPNGVDAARFRPDVAASRPGGAGTFTVGFCGHLKPWHGVAVLAEAFGAVNRRHPNSRLLVVGDGPEREPLLGYAAANGFADAVELTGRVDAGDVPGLLASMDVATAPYPATADCYFSPLKLVEYMAAGVPVVASRIGQIAEVVEDGVTGTLCAAGDAAELAAALERVMADPAAARRRAAAARGRVVERYTWDAVVGRVLALAGFTLAEATT